MTIHPGHPGHPGLSRPVPGPPPRARRRRDPLVPHQHGAWAFLGLPLVVGALVAPPATRSSATDLTLLAVAWVAAYPLSWAVTGLLAHPRPERFRRAAVTWALVAAPAAALLLLRHPWLWVAGAVLGCLFAVNLGFALRRRERALANDAVLVVECALVVPLVAGVGAPLGSWSVPWDRVLDPHVVLAALLCALTLAESTLHVRSYLRERRRPAFGRIADVAAVAAVGVATLLALLWGGSSAWLLVVPYVWGVARAQAIRVRTAAGSPLPPARLGLLELVGFLLLAAAVGLAHA